MAKGNKFSVSEGLFSNSPKSGIETIRGEENTTYSNLRSTRKGKLGRPGSATEPVQPISFRLTKKQHTAIKMFALKYSMDQSEALRKIIDESELLQEILQNL